MQSVICTRGIRITYGVGTDNGKHTPTYLSIYIYLSGSSQPFRRRLLFWPDIRRSSLVKPYYENMMPPLLSRAVDPSDRRSTFTVPPNQNTLLHSRRVAIGRLGRGVCWRPAIFLSAMRLMNEWRVLIRYSVCVCEHIRGIITHTSHRTASCTSAHHASTTRCAACLYSIWYGRSECL